VFFQDVENGLGHALTPRFDPQGLRLPHIQEHFRRVLAAGGSELTIEEIKWEEVIRKWRLPAPARGTLSAELAPESDTGKGSAL
jgi:hypothetical protein